MINRRKGVTFVELTLVLGLVSFLSMVVYQVFHRQVKQATDDGEASKYYLDMGILVETLQNDLAMARDIRPASQGMTLVVNPDGTLETITYSLKGKQIERKFRGAGRLFSLHNPNRKETPLVFRIEETPP